jgi:hypothetical protein
VLLMPGCVLCARDRLILSIRPVFAACGHGGRGAESGGVLNFRVSGVGFTALPSDLRI